MILYNGKKHEFNKTEIALAQSMFPEFYLKKNPKTVKIVYDESILRRVESHNGAVRYVGPAQVGISPKVKILDEDTQTEVELLYYTHSTPDVNGNPVYFPSNIDIINGISLVPGRDNELLIFLSQFHEKIKGSKACKNDAACQVTFVRPKEMATSKYKKAAAVAQVNALITDKNKFPDDKMIAVCDAMYLNRRNHNSAMESRMDLFDVVNGNSEKLALFLKISDNQSILAHRGIIPKAINKGFIAFDTMTSTWNFLDNERMPATLICSVPGGVNSNEVLYKFLEKRNDIFETIQDLLNNEVKSKDLEKLTKDNKDKSAALDAEKDKVELQKKELELKELKLELEAKNKALEEKEESPKEEESSDDGLGKDDEPLEVGEKSLADEDISAEVDVAAEELDQETIDNSVSSDYPSSVTGIADVKKHLADKSLEDIIHFFDGEERKMMKDLKLTLVKKLSDS